MDQQDQAQVGTVSQAMRTALTEKDNETFDIARMSFAMIMVGWMISLLTFLVMASIHFWKTQTMDGFASGAAVLFGCLTGIIPCAGWAIHIKRDTEHDDRDRR